MQPICHFPPVPSLPTDQQKNEDNKEHSYQLKNKRKTEESDAFG